MSLYKKPTGDHPNRQTQGYNNNNSFHANNHNSHFGNRNEPIPPKEEMNDNIKAIMDYIENPSQNYKIFSYYDGAIYKEFNRSEKTTSSQLRKFYTSVIGIAENYRDPDTAMGQLSMIIPHIYYAKQRNVVPGDFFDFFRKAITTLENKKDGDNNFEISLKAFRDVLQAIVAYTTSQKGGN